MGLRVLASGVDSLYLGIYCDLSPELYRQLEQTRAVLDEEGKAGPIPFPFGGREVLYQRGKGWRHMLRVPEAWRLFVQQRRERDQAAPAQLMLDSRPLWTFGARRAADEWFRRYFDSLGFDLQRVIVSRADITADWIGWRPVPEDQNGFCCRGRVVRADFGWKQDQVEVGDDPAVKVREERPGHFRQWSVGAFSGWTFGLGSIGARLYDKEREIADSSGKWWFEDVWQRSSEEVGETVWRLEFQLKRAVLRELGVDRLPDLWPRLSRIWRYCAGGERIDPVQAQLAEQGLAGEPAGSQVGWLTLREPSAALQKSRWPLREEWRYLQGIPFDAASSAPAVRDRTEDPSQDKAWQDLVCALARVVGHEGARGGLEGWEEAAEDVTDAAFWAANDLRLKAVATRLGWGSRVERILQHVAASAP